jgi:hypothetical protein
MGPSKLGKKSGIVTDPSPVRGDGCNRRHSFAPEGRPFARWSVASSSIASETVSPSDSNWPLQHGRSNSLVMTPVDFLTRRLVGLGLLLYGSSQNATDQLGNS